jgi:hypothetical protein
MGRTYRNKDKRFKKQLRNQRRVRKNKRSIWEIEYFDKKSNDQKQSRPLESYLFA